MMTGERLIIFHIIHLFLIPTKASEDGFYAIAHMVNSKRAVKYAMDAGANAVELDLMFEEKQGVPTRFYHGAPCDCTCYRLLPFFSSGNICFLSHRPCNTGTRSDELLQYLLKFSNLALVYIDSKISKLSARAQKLAAKNIITLAQENLFNRGYKGKILIGAGQNKPYLSAVSYHVKMSECSSSIYVTLDWNKKGTFDSLEYLSNLPISNVVFSEGHSACYSRTYHQAIRTAAINAANGVVSKVFVWTVDLPRSFATYYENGARGILTNRIVSLMEWVKENSIKLAVPADNSLQPATSKMVLKPICDCRHHNSGCIVSKLPPKNTACYCKKSPFSTCSGYPIVCRHAQSAFCKHPHYTVQHCIQGGGNCDGYKKKICDCTYHFKWGGGGCRVTISAPPHTACRCDYTLFSCHGHVVACRHAHDSYCFSPDTSISSCRLAVGGDCGGYS